MSKLIRGLVDIVRKKRHNKFRQKGAKNKHIAIKPPYRLLIEKGSNKAQRNRQTPHNIHDYLFPLGFCVARGVLTLALGGGLTLDLGGLTGDFFLDVP